MIIREWNEKNLSQKFWSLGTSLHKFAAKQRPNFFNVVFVAWCTSDAFRHCGTPWTIWSSQPPSSCCCHLRSASFKLHVMTLLGGSMIGTFKCTLGVAKFQTTACPHSDHFCLSWKIYLAKFHQLVFSNSQLRCLKVCRETTFQYIIGVPFYSLMYRRHISTLRKSLSNLILATSL